MDNRHERGAVMNERRGQDRDELSDHDRLVALEARVKRIETFLGIFKTAFGHLWGWLENNIRGQG